VRNATRQGATWARQKLPDAALAGRGRLAETPTKAAILIRLPWRVLGATLAVAMAGATTAGTVPVENWSE